MSAHGSWDHPAADWREAFERAYRVVGYLLDGDPLPMRATVLLVPEGASYQRAVTETGTSYVPITLAFHYPASPSGSDEATRQGLSALVGAVSRTVTEYQHVVFEAAPTRNAWGHNDVEKAINDEALSECWRQSTLVALLSGTDSAITFHPKDSVGQAAGVQRTTANQVPFEPPTPANLRDGCGRRRVKYSEAYGLGISAEGQSVIDYLRERGIRSLTVPANDPAAMNSLLSVCRAMTTHPINLGGGTYPPSLVQYVPFFPPSDHEQGKTPPG
jgi:hypothetical protein